MCLTFHRHRVKPINDNKWVIMKKNINCCKLMYTNIQDFIDDKTRTYSIEIAVLF